MPTVLHLLSDDRAAGFEHSVETAAGKLGDEAGLARTGAARHYEEMVAHGPSSGLTRKGSRSDRHAMCADQSCTNFRRKNSTWLRDRGKSSDEKGRTIWCFSKRWQASHSPASWAMKYRLKTVMR
jgi:hypothetical protein